MVPGYAPYEPNFPYWYGIAPHAEVRSPQARRHPDDDRHAAALAGGARPYRLDRGLFWAGHGVVFAPWADPHHPRSVRRARWLSPVAGRAWPTKSSRKCFDSSALRNFSLLCLTDWQLTVDRLCLMVVSGRNWTALYTVPTTWAAQRGRAPPGWRLWGSSVSDTRVR